MDTDSLDLRRRSPRARKSVGLFAFDKENLPAGSPLLKKQRSKSLGSVNMSPMKAVAQKAMTVGYGDTEKISDI